MRCEIPKFQPSKVTIKVI